MAGLQEVFVPSLPLSRFEPLIGAERYQQLELAAATTRVAIDGHIFWQVNSTASGGGVAEMLQVLVGYGRGAGLDIRWLVTHGDSWFFAITKRLHNRIHGIAGDDGDLGAGERAHYEQVAGENAALLLGQIRPGDVVLLHDPQTAGLCGPLREAGVHTVWRCHIGSDVANEWTEQAWAFLRPYVASAEQFVFSREGHVPPGFPREQVRIVPPSIDPFAPKNRDLGPDVVERIVEHLDPYTELRTKSGPSFERRDGTRGTVRHRASIVSDGPLDRTQPLLLQVSRWDRLKDMQGVMVGFARGVVGHVRANLVLVGPSVNGVADDPEGADVLRECTETWHSLDPEQRAHIHLMSLPMSDVDENAIMVNALQRCASVVVQKSLAEGFGLTVAEAMWKAKPVIASAVGGIVDQVVPGTGVLLDDPHDLDAFAAAACDLLRDPGSIDVLGRNARAQVVDDFVGDKHLLRYAAMLGDLFA